MTKQEFAWVLSDALDQGLTPEEVKEAVVEAFQPQEPALCSLCACFDEQRAESCGCPCHPRKGSDK